MSEFPAANPIDIETKRFQLRSVTAADISPTWIAWLDDPEILEPLNAPVQKHTVKSLASQLAGYDNWNHYQVGIFTRDAGRHIGLHEMNLNRKERLLQTNVLIGDKVWWGKGVVDETRSALLDYFFFEQNIAKAYGQPLARNFRMIFNYKKQGWMLDGVMEDKLISRSTGEKIDQFRFTMTREKWADLRGRKL